MKQKERVIDISVRQIGDGHPCFLVAEIGINHNGDLTLAKKMVEAAAKAGADAVKFQNYRANDFISDREITYTYKSKGQCITESQWEMFRRYEPGSNWLAELKRVSEDLGVVFFSTPTGEEGLRELVELGVPLLKNGSDYITHIPLLEQMASTGIPIVISTGMADETDIDAAVTAIRSNGGSVLLLHCTSAYPTPPNHTNIRRMLSLKSLYQAPVGFSDHTEGWAAAVQAVTLGACMIEKHFTLDRNLPGPDHWFSSDPDEFLELVRQVRLAESRMGSPAILPATIEASGRLDYRVSAIAAKDLEIGAILTSDSITLKRPGIGILPKDLPQYFGRKLVHPVKRGTPLRPADLEVPEAC